MSAAEKAESDKTERLGPAVERALRRRDPARRPPDDYIFGAAAFQF